MKKILVIFAAALLFAACSDDNDNNNPQEERCNTVIADYLYGVEYDDYDFLACKNYFDNQYIPSSAGCSEVRRGDFVGRNLDWFINRNASAIIKINRAANHYASIGVVGCFPQFSNEVAKSGEQNEVYKYLPFKTEDGVNEYGLYVGVNVMPTGETSFDKSKWKTHEYGLSAAGTNPSATMTCAVNYLPRILLDKAKNVEEAKKIIASINWTDPKDYPEKGESQSFHWLICDREKSVVLEFIENEAVYTEAESVTEPSFGTIMTNFTNCLWKAGIMQYTGIGYERFDVLKNNYKNYKDYPDNFDGMQKLMEQVWFTKLYTTPLGKDTWLSEHSSEDYWHAEDLYGHYELLEVPELRAILQAAMDLFKDKSLWYVDDTPLWFSTHTSVYNIKDKKLHVLVHEGLDGMKEFYEVSLDNTHFVKVKNW